MFYKNIFRLYLFYGIYFHSMGMKGLEPLTLRLSGVYSKPTELHAPVA
jgi:hypothetical protein